MDIWQASIAFEKLAQTLDPPTTPGVTTLTPNEQTLYTNHVIKINQQAHLLNNAIDNGIKRGLMLSDARFHGMTLQNLAVRLTGFVLGRQQPQPTTVQIRTLYNQIASEYATLRNNYIHWENNDLNMLLNPIMKSIQDSLVFVDRFIRKLEGLQTILPAIGMRKIRLYKFSEWLGQS